MNNFLSYCGLIDAKIRASDKGLTVILTFLEIRKTFLKTTFECFVFQNYQFTSKSQLYKTWKGYA